MRALLDSLVEELRELRREGVERVAVSESSLEMLESSVERLRVAQPEQAAPERPEAKPPVPVAKPAPAKKTKVEVQVATSKKALPEPPELTLPEGSKQERYDWLRERVLGCPVCNEHVREEKKVVIGSGNLDSPIFFCGEAPGADEETKGEVFVGPAGELLKKIIGAMGLSREKVYIGNIMNWRPEVAVGNRPPTPEEMRFCMPYLRAQLEIIQPKVVVALGKTAMEGLLGSKQTLRSARGKWHDFDSIALMVTYHPSYLLRNNTLRTKREVWEDMLKVMERLEMDISEKQRGYFLKG